MKEQITENTIFYAIALTFVNKIGSITAKKLISHYKDPENIFKESKSSIIKNKLLTPSIAESLFSKSILNCAEKEMNFISKYNINVIYYKDENYSYRLNQCYDAPIILYSKGSAGLNPLKSVSVVGTRKSTIYGSKQTKSIIKSFQGEPMQIVSGLAYGIDTIAHKSALENKLETIAVLGTGLNMIYPAENKDIAIEICKNGALITEFNSQLKPEKENFPRRNRIIAGMSDAILVMESNTKGGSLITAELANSYSRDVFALPGRSDDKYSSGCNWLIKKNKAGMITSAEDVYYGMNWDFLKKEKQAKQMPLILSSDEEKVYRLLKENEECNIDFICNTIDFTLSKTAGILLNMEMLGIIRSMPGKIYRIN